MGWVDAVSVKKKKKKKKGADPSSNLRQPLNIQQRNSKLLKGDSLPKFILTENENSGQRDREKHYNDAKTCQPL